MCVLCWLSGAHSVIIWGFHLTLQGAVPHSSVQASPWPVVRSLYAASASSRVQLGPTRCVTRHVLCCCDVGFITASMRNVIVATVCVAVLSIYRPHTLSSYVPLWRTLIHSKWAAISVFESWECLRTCTPQTFTLV